MQTKIKYTLFLITLLNLSILKAQPIPNINESILHSFLVDLKEEQANFSNKKTEELVQDYKQIAQKIFSINLPKAYPSTTLTKSQKEILRYASTEIHSRINKLLRSHDFYIKNPENSPPAELLQILTAQEVLFLDIYDEIKAINISMQKENQTEQKIAQIRSKLTYILQEIYDFYQKPENLKEPILTFLLILMRPLVKTAHTQYPTEFNKNKKN